MHFPEHRDFVGKKKNHLVKLAFSPVLRQLAHVFDTFVCNGIAPTGLEDVTTWQLRPAIKEGRVALELLDGGGKHLVDVSPLQAVITTGDLPDDQVVDALYNDFLRLVPGEGDDRIRAFITERADFRNKLLYADDGQWYSMGETLAQLRPDVEQDLRRLLWCLAAVLTNKPVSKKWGPVGQFIALYRRVLLEAKVLRRVELEALGLLPSMVKD